MTFEYPISLTVMVTSVSEMRAVYAVLANPSLADPLLLKNFWGQGIGDPRVATALAQAAGNTATVKAEAPGLAGALGGKVLVTGEVVTSAADGNKDVSISTVNVNEPAEEAPAAPKRRGRPPKAKDTGTSEPSQESNAIGSATSPAATEAENAQNDTTEDDEFAAFRSAMAKTEETDEKAAASVPERKWTDADLSALNNQAAQKVGPARVPEIKAIVAKYVPDGEVPHSRNIPEGDRATYAREIEELAGIEFAG